MKLLKIILIFLSFLPIALFAAPKVAQAIKQIDDKRLTEAYNNFKKKPSKASFDAFDASLYNNNTLEDLENRSDNNSRVKRSNWYSIRDYINSARNNNLVRIKATKFNFPKQEDGEKWNLRIEISLLTALIFRDIPVSKGDFSKLSIPIINGEVALNKPFDNDYISFRYMVYDPNGGRLNDSPVSKFFEVSKYEIIAKSMDTGECEIKFADKNLGTSVSFKFYNLPAVALPYSKDSEAESPDEIKKVREDRPNLWKHATEEQGAEANRISESAKAQGRRMNHRELIRIKEIERSIKVPEDASE